MRSKNNRKKPASQRQGKLAFYLKRIAVFSSIGILSAGILTGAYFLVKAFYVRDFQVSGNKHLDKRDIESMLNIRREPLLDLRLKEIETKLKRSAWIRNVSLRWLLPGTLVINVEEASPRALLSYGGEMFLVNEEGNIMEALEEQATPFLPVLKGIDPRYKKVMSEAMRLVEALTAKNAVADRQYVEIGLESYGLTANIDGEFIMVGYGQYLEKFDRWVELEPELQKRGVPIQYIDLRFKDSVIVKPVTAEKDKGKDKVKEKDKLTEKDRKEKRIS
ncbi:MAG: FtsQ-type POTRA domain-containing protein [Nitrospiraceae bacterium]|nr:MAG: FtsQ-type POTRA domain-containing protein [Nitrospiraceae bacterium]